MSESKKVLIAALAKNGYTLDDVREWSEKRQGMYRVLIHTHRVVWYYLSADGCMSPM